MESTGPSPVFHKFTRLEELGGMWEQYDWSPLASMLAVPPPTSTMGNLFAAFENAILDAIRSVDSSY